MFDWINQLLGGNTGGNTGGLGGLGGVQKPAAGSVPFNPDERSPQEQSLFNDQLEAQKRKKMMDNLAMGLLAMQPGQRPAPPSAGSPHTSFGPVGSFAAMAPYKPVQRKGLL